MIGEPSVHNHLHHDGAAGDVVSRLLEHVGVHARTFFSGPLCGAHAFGLAEGVGHLHVVRSGRMSLRQRGSKGITVGEPSLVFYPRPLSHRILVADSESAEVVCARLRYDIGADNAVTRSFPPVVVMPFRIAPALEPILSLMFAEADGERLGRAAMLDRACEILLVQIIRYAVERGTVSGGVLAGLSHRHLAKTVAAVLDRPGATWSVARMAADAHISRNVFSREFTRTLGTTPAAFLLDARIALAQRLLLDGRPLGVVAEAAGYRSQPAFSRAFIRRIGQGPTHWLHEQSRAV